MKTLLIVDDSAFMRTTIKHIASAAGFTVIAEAENGILGLQQYKKHNPYAVMMDVTMDEMCGISTLREIIEYDPNAKVVMVSAMGQEIIVKDAIKAGAMDFVVKPFKHEHISKALLKL